MFHQLKYLLISLTAIFAVAGANAQEPFKRGLEQVSFVPKGQWITGLNVSYSQSHQNNYQFLIIENLSGDTYSFKVSPMLMFAFRSNLAAGGRFGYSRSKTKIDKTSFVLGSDTSYDLDHLYSINQQFFGTAAFRNYISLGNSQRFGFFNEVQLQVGGGESKLVSGSGESLTGTFERNVSVDVGLTPGVIMFLNNYSAIEVSIGVLGFSYNKTNSTTDQIYLADRYSKSANFKINLFSVSFGVAFYL